MALKKSTPFRELILHESVRSFQPHSLPCLLRVITGMRFLPWKSSSISVGSAKFKAQALGPQIFLCSSGSQASSFCHVFLPLKIKTFSLTDWFAECIICYSSCFHDAKTIGSPSSHFNFFLDLFYKVVSFLCYCFICGEDSPLTCPIPSLHRRRVVSSTCLRIQIGVTNQCSCLFVRALWQIQKLNQSTKLFLWSGCSGDCGLKWKSDHCSKKGGSENPSHSAL